MPNPLIGLASRWLREQIATDHHADDRIARIEHEASREAQQQLGERLLPGLHRHNEEQRARRARAAAHEEAERRAALDRVDGCSLVVDGDLQGVLPSRLAVAVEHDEDVLQLTVEPDAEPGAAGRAGAGLAGAASGGVPFQALHLAVPGFRGEGAYDLRAAHHEDWDPLWFLMVLDPEDEHFFWAPDVGVCRVSVAGGVAQIAVDFADAASRRVHLSGRLPLPSV